MTVAPPLLGRPSPTFRQIGGADKYANKVSVFKKEYPEIGHSPSLPAAALGKIWGMKNLIGPKRSNGFQYFKLSERDKAISAMLAAAPAVFISLSPQKNKATAQHTKLAVNTTGCWQMSNPETKTSNLSIVTKAACPVKEVLSNLL